MPDEKQVIYIAIGPNVWGKGFTKDQALAAMRKSAGVARPKQWLVFTVTDAWAYVDQYGNLCRTQESESIEVERHNMPKK